LKGFLRKLAKDTAVYGISSVFGRMLNYFLVPLYTSRLLPEEYGILTEFYAYAAFLNILYAYGMETAYLRFACGKEALVLYRYIGSLLFFASAFFSILLVGAAKPITDALGYPNQEWYVYCLVAILALDNFLLVPFAHLRLTRQAVLFAQAKFVQILVNIGINVVYLGVFPLIAQGLFCSSLQPHIQAIYHPSQQVFVVFAANFLGNACAIPFLWSTLKKFRFAFNWQQCRPILRYAWPLLVMGLAGTTNEMLGRVLLKHKLPLGFYANQSKTTILGIVGACHKLAIFMTLGIQAFRYAAEPFFFAHAKDQQAPLFFKKIMEAYILLACFIWLAISANLDFLGYLFLRHPVYRNAIEIVPYLAFSYLWLGIYYNLSVWFKVCDKTYYGMWFNLGGALVTICLNIFLVPRLGYWGSIWATLASYSFMAIGCYLVGQKKYPIPYSLASSLGVIFVTFFLVVGVRYVFFINTSYTIGFKILVTLIYGIIVYKKLMKLS